MCPDIKRHYEYLTALLLLDSLGYAAQTQEHCSLDKPSADIRCAIQSFFANHYHLPPLKNTKHTSNRPQGDSHKISVSLAVLFGVPPPFRKSRGNYSRAMFQELLRLFVILWTARLLIGFQPPGF